MVRPTLISEVPTHVPLLLARARRLCRNEADARDLVQDTCLHAIEALRRTGSDPDNLPGWLVIIMRNRWFSAIRQHRVRAHAHAQMVQGPPIDVTRCETSLVYSHLSQAWTRLPAQSQNIAQQCLIEGHSQEEVSRRLGMTAGGVAASIHRTRQTLRQSVYGAAA